MSALIDLSGPLAPPQASPEQSSSSPSVPAATSTNNPPPSAPLTRGGTNIPLAPLFQPPVIQPVERTAEWAAHLAAVRAYFAPAGYAEDAAAFTIAALQWRLNRLTRSETEHLAHSIAAAEHDAALLVAQRASESASEPPHIRSVLPTDPAALRRCVKDARLASQVIPGFHTWPNHDPISDDHAHVANSFLAAFYSHSPTNPPPERPSSGWNGTHLRTALTRLAVNRSVYDDIAPAAAFASGVATAAERRLAEIDSLATQLRRERLVPQSPLATHIRESESALSAQLDLAIRQLDLLQARRLGLPPNS